MKAAKKKLKKYKIKPKFLPNGDILDADELMIKHDFDNDPVFKAKLEEAKADFRKYPPPGYTSEDFK
jgi:hypothetical protein